MNHLVRDWILILLAWFVIFLMLCGLAVMGAVVPLQFVYLMLAGWALFLARNAGQITFDPATLGLALLCLIAFTCGLHYFLRSLTRGENRIAIKDSDDALAVSRSKWRWRWSMSLVAVLITTFAAGVSAYGLVRQIAWFKKSTIPTTVSSTFTSRRERSANRLKQLALAAQQYAEAQPTLPPGATVSDKGDLLHSWMTLMLPYLGELELFNQIDLAVPWNHSSNEEAIKRWVEAYDSDFQRSFVNGYPTAGYSANAHVISGARARAMSEIIDGVSQTILFGEIASDPKPWGYPKNWRDPAIGIDNPAGFGSPQWGAPVHSAYFVFADGSVREIPKSVDPKVLRALATPAGGEIVIIPPLDISRW